MPTINRPKKKDRRRITPARKSRQRVYQTKVWQDMRRAQLMANPLCAVCELEGRTVLAIDVHHLRSFMSKEGTERMGLAYDMNNLISLCKQCHNRIHHGNLQGCESLSELECRIAHLYNKISKR